MGSQRKGFAGHGNGWIVGVGLIHLKFLFVLIFFKLTLSMQILLDRPLLSFSYIYIYILLNKKASDFYLQWKYQTLAVF